MPIPVWVVSISSRIKGLAGKLAARETLLGAIIGAVAVLAAAVLPGLIRQDPPAAVAVSPPIVKVEIAGAVVPPPKEVTPVQELKEPEGDAFRLLRDISIFDLRAWKVVPAALKMQRISPVNYINYLHVKKVRAADTFIAHYSTSGSAIDLRCITHNARISQRQISDPVAPKSYAVEVDVRSVPLNREFMIVIEGTYWNSFQNLSEETAGTYVDPDGQQLEELALIVLLPESKPFKRTDRLTGDEKSNDIPYRGDESFYADREGRFIYWSIKEREVGRHYYVKWAW
jgi:hypothetical protein